MATNPKQPNNCITLTDATFRYGQSEIISHLNLKIQSGDFIGITGSNGSGKTTLTYLFNGLIPHVIEGALSGEVAVNGISTRKKSVAYFAREVGMVFQNPDFALFNLTVREEILFGITNLNLTNPQTRIQNSLKQVGMETFIDRDPKTLSFGQKQKINLACVLALETPIIVLDEPTAMLDFKSSLELYQILAKINAAGTTVIVVEHDTDFLLEFSKSVLVLNQGSVAAQEKTATLFKEKQRLLKDLGIKIPRPLSL